MFFGKLKQGEKKGVYKLRKGFGKIYVALQCARLFLEEKQLYGN